ncbi:MAG: hypothetical protein EXR97_01575 [Nitrospiraceae bacterium]|nr:hypothetical protein [Nitrospiraceae bacterium]MSR24391.1 hypothetical protein [Nitrospiraceae bacterium]
MPKDIVEKHQLAGLDEHERGFNRVVELERDGGMCRAMLRYETTFLVTDSRATQADALVELILLLHTRGFRQLRSQLSFRENTYCGNQEPWIEYPDPEFSVRPPDGIIARLFGWLRQGEPRA